MRRSARRIRRKFMGSTLGQWLLRGALVGAVAYGVFVAGVLQEYSQDDVPEAARAAGLSTPLADPNVYVSTKRGILELRDGDSVVKRYECAFGVSTIFGRLDQNARSTPLGEYRVVSATATRELGGRGARFLRIDWPSVDDAARALDAGFVSRADYDAIAAAAAIGAQPKPAAAMTAAKTANESKAGRSRNGRSAAL